MADSDGSIVLKKDRTKDQSGRFVQTHGLSLTPEYYIWADMIRRCTDNRDPSYKSYGARGIKVCPSWRSVTTFVEDMGQRPSPRHTLDRIDNSLGYCKSNCRWATRLVQGNNKRNNHCLTHNGVTRTLAGWERETGIKQSTIRQRLKYGWSVSDALTIEAAPRNRTSRSTRRKPSRSTSQSDRSLSRT